jgi:hypothetical protein
VALLEVKEAIPDAVHIFADVIGYKGRKRKILLMDNRPENIAGQTDGLPIQGNAYLAEEPIIPPSREILTALFESARKGDILSIKNYADQIEQFDPQLLPFAETLRRFVKGFEINNIKKFIQAYLEERHE